MKYVAWILISQFFIFAYAENKNTGRLLNFIDEVIGNQVDEQTFRSQFKIRKELYLSLEKKVTTWQKNKLPYQQLSIEQKQAYKTYLVLASSRYFWEDQSAKEVMAFRLELATLLKKFDDASIPEFINLDQRINFKFRLAPPFQKGQGASYYPSTQTIELNLHDKKLKPLGLLDSYIHEAYHAIKPASLKQLDQVWWFEGETEYKTEQVMQRLDFKRSWDDVQYPVLTVYYALKIEEPNLVNRLIPNEQALSSKEQKKIEELLTNWGWKEDNGSRISLDRYLLDGHWRADKLYEMYTKDSDFFMELFRARILVAFHFHELNYEDLNKSSLEAVGVNLQGLIRHVVSYANEPKLSWPRYQSRLD
ncbi:MAG: hypothetical protein MK193_00920 [Lentisphaeria bacterium]|nr:hypothetical protein [Lentisphaeria bacterium]